jgi:hypothetical protein
MMMMTMVVDYDNHGMIDDDGSMVMMVISRS